MEISGLKRQACLCTPANAGFFVFGLREIHQIHLNVDLVFSVVLNKTGIFAKINTYRHALNMDVQILWVRPAFRGG